jgi:crossover junction endodeoxyribonuclease RuvC
MKILGIDPGTGIMGWGLIRKEGAKIVPLGYGCVRTESKDSMPDRLNLIFDELNGIIKKEKPDEVAVESLFFFKNQKTVITVAQARGVAIVCAKIAKLPVFEYTPLQVKQALTGYGRADKNQIQQMVKITCKLKECPKPDDAADALAVAITHAQSNLSLIGKSEARNPKHETISKS